MAHLYDPPPTDVEYDAMALTRPLTGAALGEGSSARRSRDARLSALMLGRERERRRLICSPWTGRAYLLDGSIWSGAKDLEHAGSAE